jgi:hypothetical protein
VLLEAPLTEWDEPTVRYEGVTLTEISGLDESVGGLTSYEAKQFASYEYTYLITTNVEDTKRELCIDYVACAGCDPSTDLQIDFAARGNYLSVDGMTVKQGAARDDSSYTVVFTVQDITWDIS